MRRLLALLLVTLGLAPGTWWRSPVPLANSEQVVSFTPVAAGVDRIGPLEVAGAWVMRSPNAHFGSYSALIALGDGTLLAASDRGRSLRFSPPGARPQRPQLDYFAGRRTARKSQADIEALARDPATGSIWAAFEVSNRIEFLALDIRNYAAIEPVFEGIDTIFHEAAIPSVPQSIDSQRVYSAGAGARRHHSASGKRAAMSRRNASAAARSAVRSVSFRCRSQTSA